MTRAEMAFACVQDLYLLQVTLLRAFEGDLEDPRTRREVHSNLRTFQELLDVADHRYMGGEDVLEAFRSLPGELLQEMKKKRRTANVARVRKSASAKK